MVKQINSTDNYHVLFHQPDGPIGRFTLHRHDRRPGVGTLWGVEIYPPHRGEGWGWYMMADLFTLARKRGFTRIWLYVWSENAVARRLYERCGFQYTVLPPPPPSIPKLRLEMEREV